MHICQVLAYVAVHLRKGLIVLVWGVSIHMYIYIDSKLINFAKGSLLINTVSYTGSPVPRRLLPVIYG